MSLLEKDTIMKVKRDNKIAKLPEVFSSLHFLVMFRAEEYLILGFVLDNTVHYLYGRVQQRLS